MGSIEQLLSKRQQSELITAIQGRGEIPLKFVYVGRKGAYNWNARAAHRLSSKHGINSVEGQLLGEKMQDFFTALPKGFKKINLIDIGCGNGEPVFPILAFLKNNKLDFRYVPLDISSDMVALAIDTIGEKFGKIETKEVVFDFEQGNFSDVACNLKQNGEINLFLFLGSTLGNQADMNRVLSNFRDSMDVNDFMILGVEFSNLAKISLMLSNYDIKNVGNFLYYIPEAIGIKREQTSYNATWNELKNQVEIRITLKKETKIRIGNQPIPFEAEEQLFIAKSAKFTAWTLQKVLADAGFRTEIMVTDKKNSYSLSMVQPTRYTA